MSINGLNTDYMQAPSFQEYFVDKDTGLPLRGGYVEYFKDQARTTKKPIFALSGSPPNYSYVEIENPVPLTAVGTLSDGMGNDITPYYYPYDENGNLELYYAKVYSSNDVFQYDRQGIPNVSTENQTTDSLENFIPNGQLLLHTNIPVTSTTVAGEITKPITQIAYGKFSFERPVNSTAKDIVTFVRLPSFTDNPTASPRYALRVNTQSPSSGDTYKDIRITFLDVNKFASDTQQYTFSFNGQSNTGSNVNIGFFAIKNFGTGGSISTTTSISTITLTPSSQQLNTSFVFGDNIGKTIGNNDDDYVQLVLRLPLSVVFDLQLTDFILTINNVTISVFPATTNKDFVVRSVAAPVPAHDGSDLYLPLRLTPQGLEYDHSEIAKIVSSVASAPGIGELLCNGEKYETEGYSSDGIPYRRLFDKIHDFAHSVCPFYGTGIDFSEAYVNNGNASIIRLKNNSKGAVTAISNGSTPTPFTFETIATGNDTGYGVKSYTVGTNSLIIENISNGVSATPNMATSGFTFSGNIKDGIAGVSQVSVIIVIDASGLAGKYFNFYTPTTAYYVWFKVNGAGSDPAPGGTGILVNLLSSDIVVDVAGKISNTLKGAQVSQVSCTSAASITSGSYFTFMSSKDGSGTSSYYVWYQKDGAGSDPAPGGTGIKVAIASSQTANDICGATCLAINSKYFAVPDLRGYFLRSIGGAADTDIRYSPVDFATATVGSLGSFQYDSNQQHLHSASTSTSISQVTPASLNGAGGVYTNTPSGASMGPGPDDPFFIQTLTVNQAVYSAASTTTVFSQGRGQSQPQNFGVNFFIKY